ncbi:hypothetical protein GA0070606_3297 [Micromonospora citrea]|uniref:Uncharacterized protein n=1 Tax=Micromonospora citrea TaxID=47855 RepID=A0A1C6V2X7_9ACTN|nr:hypothetical protein GA0070606_3297 [Micromonospora citrea]
MTTDQSAAGGPHSGGPAGAPASSETTGDEARTDRAAGSPKAGDTTGESAPARAGAEGEQGKDKAGTEPGTAVTGPEKAGTGPDRAATRPGRTTTDRAGTEPGRATTDRAAATDGGPTGQADAGRDGGGALAGNGESKHGGNKGADGKGDEGRTGESGGSKAAAGKSADGKTTDAKDGDGKTTEGKSVDAKTTDAKTTDAKTTDAKTTEGKTTEGKDGDGKEAGKPDRWAAFAPAPEAVPGRPRRAARWVGRLLIHEWTLATVGSLVLAVLLTWPTLRYPLHTIPQDYWDPTLQAWQMAWSGHILLTNPAQLWQSNAFFPEDWSFAFSDTLLGYAPAGMIGNGPEAAVLRYNIMFVLAHALATLGAYALARQLGAGRIGGAVAGVSYAYAPWLLAQAGHLHVISNGGIPLALAMLARGHGYSLRHGYRPERRHDGWVYAGWLVAAWQLSLGFGIGLPFAYFLGGAVLVAAVTFFLRRWVIRPVKRPFGRRLLLADLVGGLIFAGVGALMAIPYFKVAELHPQAERTIGDIAIFSPPASGFFTAPGESRVWGELHEGARAALPWHPEMTLLPGFVLYALAAGGLFFSVWKLRHRLLLLAGVVVTMVLAMGTRFFDGTFTYVPLFEHVPGWNGLRTPGRLMLWTTLLLGLLAAGAVSAFAARVREISAERIPSWPSPWLRLATLLPLVLVIAEGLNTTPHPVVPQQPAAMRTVAGPLLVLPSSQSHDQPVMLWSTTKFQDIVNGGSGFTPRQLDEVRRVSLSFPDQTSVDYLRVLGVRNVLLMRDQIAGTPWEVTIDAPVDGLGITREEMGQVVVYRL